MPNRHGLNDKWLHAHLTQLAELPDLASHAQRRWVYGLGILHIPTDARRHDHLGAGHHLQNIGQHNFLQYPLNNALISDIRFVF